MHPLALQRRLITADALGNAEIPGLLGLHQSDLKVFVQLPDDLNASRSTANHQQPRHLSFVAEPAERVEDPTVLRTQRHGGQSSMVPPNAPDRSHLTATSAAQLSQNLTGSLLCKVSHLQMLQMLMPTFKFLPLIQSMGMPTWSRREIQKSPPFSL